MNTKHERIPDFQQWVYEKYDVLLAQSKYTMIVRYANEYALEYAEASKDSHWQELLDRLDAHRFTVVDNVGTVLPPMHVIRSLQNATDAYRKRLVDEYFRDDAAKE